MSAELRPSDYTAQNIVADFEPPLHTEQHNMPLGLNVEVVYWGHGAAGDVGRSSEYVAGANVVILENMNPSDKTLRALQQVANAPLRTKPKHAARDIAWAESLMRQNGIEEMTPIAQNLLGSKAVIACLDPNIKKEIFAGYNELEFRLLLDRTFAPSAYLSLPFDEAIIQVKSRLKEFGEMQGAREQVVATNLVAALPEYADPTGESRLARLFYGYLHAGLPTEIGRYGIRAGEQAPELVMLRPMEEVILRYRMGQDPDETTIAQALLGLVITDRLFETLRNRTDLNSPLDQGRYEAMVTRSFTAEEARDCFEHLRTRGSMDKFTEIMDAKGIPRPGNPDIRAFTGI